ncbi:VF530 family protein [Undibacterium sp. TS12]|uniref:VF530 family protein n=1 Tax=Undibacterium sp. TS12 TaxID=2908202 RepID=UPI001F4C6EB3|nr:VF530 family protein [Undibacterium sp. TS12]MCH8621739.1 VF530 family protein [Undibacterium sp. TS12]
MKQPLTPRTLQHMTLEAILEQLVAHYGWEQLGKMIEIRCFTSDPSIKSSLKFLRKTPWARTKVEELYRSMPE